MWVIFDLDGTIADIEERRKISRKANGKIDWGIFFDSKNIRLDKPVYRVIELCSALKSAGYNIAILSGRGEETRLATEQWLAQYGVKYDKLRMRPVQNHEPDDDLKRKWLNEDFNKKEILCTFDDRNKVVEMWRQEGLLCCQVAPGDF